MVFNNDDYRAITAMENHRLEAEDDFKICPVCGTENPEEFFTSIQTDECVGCSDCINKYEWIDY